MEERNKKGTAAFPFFASVCIAACCQKAFWFLRNTWYGKEHDLDIEPEAPVFQVPEILFTRIRICSGLVISPRIH